MELNINEQCDSVKLIKNTKGYNWEIKVYKREKETQEQYLQRLASIDADLNVKYGTIVPVGEWYGNRVYWRNELGKEYY